MISVKDARWGHAEGGPYDAIFFGGAVTEVSNTVGNFRSMVQGRPFGMECYLGSHYG